MQWLKKPTITETVRLTTLCWFGHAQGMEENRIPESVGSKFGSNKAER